MVAYQRAEGRAQRAAVSEAIFVLRIVLRLRSVSTYGDDSDHPPLPRQSAPHSSAERRRRNAVSLLVRAAIRREVEQEGFDYEKVRHLIGSVRLDREKMRGDVWAEEIRRKNWRK